MRGVGCSIVLVQYLAGYILQPAVAMVDGTDDIAFLPSVITFEEVAKTYNFFTLFSCSCCAHAEIDEEEEGRGHAGNNRQKYLSATANCPSSVSVRYRTGYAAVVHISQRTARNLP